MHQSIAYQSTLNFKGKKVRCQTLYHAEQKILHSNKTLNSIMIQSQFINICKATNTVYNIKERRCIKYVLKRI